MEIGFSDTEFGGCGWVHQVDSLWLVTVVSVVGHRAPNFEGHIGTDRWATEGSVFVLGFANVVRTVELGAAAQIGIRSELVVVRLTGDALTSVPHSVVVLVAVDVLIPTGSLALAKVLNGSKVISRNGFHVLNDFFDNDCLGVGFFNPLSVYCLSSTVEKPLLTKAKAVRLRLTLDHGVASPVVLSDALLARVVVAVSALIHLRVGCGFLSGTASREQDVLGLNAILGGEAKGSIASLCSLRPLVSSGHALAKGLSLD